MRAVRRLRSLAIAGVVAIGLAALARQLNTFDVRARAPELYLSPSDQDEAIYLVAGSAAERWPRVEPMRLCA